MRAAASRVKSRTTSLTGTGADETALATSSASGIIIMRTADEARRSGKRILRRKSASPIGLAASTTGSTAASTAGSAMGLMAGGTARSGTRMPKSSSISRDKWVMPDGAITGST